MDMSTHAKAYDRVDQAENMSGGRFGPVSDNSKRLGTAKQFIDSGEHLVHFKKNTNKAIATQERDTDAKLGILRMGAHVKGKDYKDALVIGERLRAGEEDILKGAIGPDGKQVESVFAAARRRKDAPLKQVEKGVKKMAKSLDMQR